MISLADRRYVDEHARLPEHLVAYVTAVTGAEAFLVGDFLLYLIGKRLIFIGYPLKEQFSDDGLKRAIDEATTRFQPETITLIAPSISPELGAEPPGPTDHYYRLHLPDLIIPSKTRNMIQRARREVAVLRAEAFGREHESLVNRFMASRPLDDGGAAIFNSIGRYCASGPDCLILEARNQTGELVAFDVADFSSRHWAMYMFNFRSEKFCVPGVSDLLLSEIIENARTAGKTAVNLGLGINPGVVFFKRKWGAEPFLPYFFRHYNPQPEPDFLSLLRSF